MALWRPGESETWRWRRQKAISFAWPCCGPRLFGRKSAETITQDVAGSVCPAHLAANSFGKRTAETPDCWSKPLPFPSLVLRLVWRSSRPCCSMNAFVTLLIRWLQPYQHWPWGHYVTLQKIILPHLYFRLTSTCFQVSLNFSII